ncbi:hypothetical protein IPM44_00570 [bacterium]|jgi:hypothetical protein|nr:MAG: hypothetical protein IPM44_00570 [bacterium]
MKKRDIIGLVIAVALIAITGVLLYTQLAPAPKDTGISVSVPAKVAVPLSDPKDQEKLTELERYEDFSKPQQCTNETCGRENPL